MVKKSFYNREYLWNWVNLCKFEAASLLGRTFFCRKPPSHSSLLHLGSGHTYLDGFVNADFYYLRWVPFKKNIPCDWLLDFRYNLNCEDNHWDGVFTEHTLEHLHYSDCLNLFKELYRTMNEGAWLRICVPGLEQGLALQKQGQSKAEIIYSLTQTWGHLSVWDADLMTEVLNDAGFTTVNIVDFMQGADERLLKDSPGRRSGSLYVEAEK